ncbi:MAG: undecaprenyl-phosphate glucose phosphotransferase, partial [Lachnospiraceae bacterium]|nr:undecaprenyl-phosphate glucose phosphotransferase [Lachnospiraceae bacterium]
MIKDNQQFFNRMHVFVDAAVTAVSYLAAWFIQFTFLAPENVGKLPFETYMVTLAFLVAGMLLLYYAFNLYTPKRVQGRRLEAGNIIKANTIALFSLILVLYMMHEDNFSRSMMMLFYGINIFLETLVRNLIRMFLMKIRKKGMNLKHILLVGYSRAAEEYIDRIRQNPQWGYLIRGVLDDNVARGTRYKDVKVIGRIDNLMVILPENRLDEIVITLGLNEYFKLEHIVALCEKSGVHTKFVPDYNNIIPTKPYTEDLLGLPVIN